MLLKFSHVLSDEDSWPIPSCKYGDIIDMDGTSGAVAARCLSRPDMAELSKGPWRKICDSALKL